MRAFAATSILGRIMCPILGGVAGLAAVTAGAVVSAQTIPTASTPLPQVVGHGGHFALMVGGAPYLMLGAQVNNASNWPAMLPKVWPAIEMMHANTVEVPAAWEQIEPKEGTYDFSFIDTLLDQARDHKVHLILLWFGTWKNNGPNYAPLWVKLDNARFPRVITKTGEQRGSLSPLFPTTLAADKTAFVALMTHLKAVDPQHTVIMVQVENETGTYGSVRDFSPTAQRLFDGPAPSALVAALHKTPGTWAQAFGKDADEYFHAWSIARYVDQVAAAGKAVYPLPMYANAALRDPFHYQDPNSYSSGGPTWNVLDVWKAATPHLDVIGPDIYTDSYASYVRTLEQYSRPDNALMVPETGNPAPNARMFFEVVGRRSIGFAPFGIDFTGYSNFPLGALKEDPETLKPFAMNYELVGPFDRLLAKLSYEGKVWGGAEPQDVHEQTIKLGRWQVTASYGRPQFGNPPAKGNPTPSGGFLVAELAPDEYLVTGYHVRLNFGAAQPEMGPSMMAVVEEGHFQDGKWVFDRLWNGDLTDWGLNFTSAPQVLKVKMATY